MDGYLDGIRKVTREDVQRVAKNYLDRDRRTVGILLPTKENT
jgi:predicted Zn-dependent peptidase